MDHLIDHKIITEIEDLLPFKRAYKRVWQRIFTRKYLEYDYFL